MGISSTRRGSASASGRATARTSRSQSSNHDEALAVQEPTSSGGASAPAVNSQDRSARALQERQWRTDPGHELDDLADGYVEEVHEPGHQPTPPSSPQGVMPVERPSTSSAEDPYAGTNEVDALAVRVTSREATPER